MALRILSHGTRSTLCPFCKCRFQKKETLVDCPKCTAPHHFDCWQQQNNRCSVFGCNGYIAPPQAQPQLNQSQQQRPGVRTYRYGFWDTRPGKLIVQGALLCSLFAVGYFSPMRNAVVVGTVVIALSWLFFTVINAFFEPRRPPE